MSKKKNRKAIEQRKRKKALKRKKGRPARLARRKDQEVLRAIKKAKTLQAAHLMKDGVQVPDITDEEYVFWLCHGANFMVSDEEQGVWDPLFEDIYSGQVPDPEAVAQRVLSKYEAEFQAEGGMTGVPHAVLAWTLTEKPQMRIYKYEAERQLREKNPELDDEAITELARQPHNGTVWGILAKTKARSLAAQLEAAPDTP